MTLQDLSQNIIDKDYKEYDTIKKSVDLYSKILPSYPPKVSGGIPRCLATICFISCFQMVMLAP